MVYLFYSLSKRQKKNEEAASKIKSIGDALKRGGYEEDRRDVNTTTIISLLNKDEHDKPGEMLKELRDSLNVSQHENRIKESEKGVSLTKIRALEEPLIKNKIG